MSEALSPAVGSSHSFTDLAHLCPCSHVYVYWWQCAELADSAVIKADTVPDPPGAYILAMGGETINKYSDNEPRCSRIIRGWVPWEAGSKEEICGWDVY